MGEQADPAAALSALRELEKWLRGDYLNRSILDCFSSDGQEIHVTLRDQTRDYSHLGDFGSKKGAVSATEPTLSAAISSALARARKLTTGGT